MIFTVVTAVSVLVLGYIMCKERYEITKVSENNWLMKKYKFINLLIIDSIIIWFKNVENTLFYFDIFLKNKEY